MKWLSCLLFCSWCMGQNVYFGDLHSHTSYSDGSGSPAQAYKAARKAGLSFMAITEHNHDRAEWAIPKGTPRRDGLLIATNPALYNGPGPDSIVSAAAKANEEPGFVALYGIEFNSTSRGNHVNVFGAPQVIDVENGAYNQLVTWLKANPDASNQTPLVQFNHPGYGRRHMEYGKDDFTDHTAWLANMDPLSQLIEVYNGPGSTADVRQIPQDHEAGFFEYLNYGFHLAPTAGLDVHYYNWGTLSDARTAVIADELSHQSIMAALRARRVYATTDKNLRLIFKVNGRHMGSIQPAPNPGSPLEISWSIKDDDEPKRKYWIQVYADVAGGREAVLIEEIHQSGDGDGAITDITFEQPGMYLFFKVIQLDGIKQRALTAPFWFDGPNTLAAAQPPGAEASSRSGIYHLPQCLDAVRIPSELKLTGSAAMENRRLHPACPRLSKLQ